ASTLPPLSRTHPTASRSSRPAATSAVGSRIRREAAQKALRVVGVKANLFPLRLGQRARAAPDLGGDAYPAEVMRQRRQRDVVGPHKEMFAALKGNAYGYGLLPVARQLVESGADGLAVVHVADAVALRREGVSTPLLLYGGHLGDAGMIGFIEDHGLTATIVDQASAELHGSLATRHIKCFLKADVGLERLGAYPADALAVARTIRRHRRLSLEGVYTH